MVIEVDVFSHGCPVSGVDIEALLAYTCENEKVVFLLTLYGGCGRRIALM